MKKYLTIVLLIILMIGLLVPTVKANSTYTIQLEVTSNESNADFDLFMLLPSNYIIYAINHAGLDIEYTGAETLIQNDIPLINVDKKNIQNETYVENGIEYVQILLEPNAEGLYTFEILSNYSEMDMKLRVKNDEKDYIMHIDNFKIEDNVCEIEYNYDKDEIKQPTKIRINFGTLLLIIVLILIVIIAIISKIKTNK